MSTLLEHKNISKYDSLLVKNSKQLSSAESTLRLLSWVLPGRFKDSEMVAEALYAAARLVSEFHDTILFRAIDELPPVLRPRFSSHARYTDFWLQHSTQYRVSARLVSLITNFQLLAEMYIIKKGSTPSGWLGDSSMRAMQRREADDAIVILESIKALARLVMFNATENRSLINPPAPTREINPTELEALTSQAESLRNAVDNTENLIANAENEALNHQQLFWVGEKSNATHPTLEHLQLETRDPNDQALHSSQTTYAQLPPSVSQNMIKRFLLKRVITAEAAKVPPLLVRQSLSKSMKAAEILNILRPLAYILALRNFGRTKISFLISFVWEILAYTLRKNALDNSIVEPSSLEQAETQNRKRSFFYYLLREPLYDNFTRPQIETLCNGLAKIPLLNIPGTIISSYLPLIGTYYYYSSN